MWMLVFGALPFAGLAYVLWHIWNMLSFCNALRWTVSVATVLAFSLVFLSVTRVIENMPIRVATVVYEVGNSMLFILLYLVMLFVVADIAAACHLLPKHCLYNNWVAAVAVTALLSVIFISGKIHYRDKKKEELTAASEKVKSKEIKILMMSDLHLGYHNGLKEFHRWVDIVNAASPDIILVGGDIIDISVRPLYASDFAGEFKRLKAPVFACLGNHEYYCGSGNALNFYKDADITPLRDSAVNINGICIIGRDDRSNTHRLPLKAIVQKYADSGNYTILLDHQPHNLAEAEAAGIDFQFSGHTHHGQVWPISWLTDLIYENAYGYSQKGNTRYYVSSGMGIWGGKFRIGTQSEYLLLTLRGSSAVDVKAENRRLHAEIQ